MSSGKGTLLITGASGYLGGNMIKAAIENGYNVRAVVRSDSSAQKVAVQFSQYKALLSYAFVPDITKSDSYKVAFNEVTGVIHAASPFILDPKNNVKDLLEPAIHGSVAILEAVQKWGTSVKRTVATSSHASCVDISKGKRPGYVYDEKDWNPSHIRGSFQSRRSGCVLRFQGTRRACHVGLGRDEQAKLRSGHHYTSLGVRSLCFGLLL